MNKNVHTLQMRSVDVAIVAIVAIVAVYASGASSRESFTHAPAFPRVMYTYWHDPNAVPQTVRECMASWARHNPGFRVVLLHPGNAAHFAPDLDRLMKHPRFSDMLQRTSDLVRACVLARNGGYWVDASVFMRAPLDAWLFRGAPADVEFAGFYIDKHTSRRPGASPTIENWFFGCAAGSPFARKWRDEFVRLADYESVDAYVESLRAAGVDFSGVEWPLYLTQHLAALAVLKNYDHRGRVHLHRAEDSAFKYLVDGGWDPEPALRRECALPTHDRASFIKFRGPERDVLERDPDLRRCVLA